MPESLHETVPHMSELPYLLQEPYIHSPFTPGAMPQADLELSFFWQRAYISFANFLDPNVLGISSKGLKAEVVTWPRYVVESEQVLVFQTETNTNGSTGIHAEIDKERTEACEFLKEVNAEFLR